MELLSHPSVSLGVPGSHGSHSHHRLQSDHLPAPVAGLPRGGHDPAVARGPRFPRRQCHQPPCHAAERRRSLQRHTLAHVTPYLVHHLRLPHGSPPCGARCADGRLHSHRGRGQQPAHYRHWPSRPVLGPRQSGRLFPLLVGNIYLRDRARHVVSSAPGYLLHLARRRGAVLSLRFACAAVLIGLTAILLQARGRNEVFPERLPLKSFPEQLGAGTGEDKPIDQETLDVLGPGDFLLREYSPQLDTDPTVNLYIAYFPSQRMGDTIHSPKNCLPGAGWLPVENDRISLPLPGHPPFPVNRYVIAKGDSRLLVLYWYWAHDRGVASEYW